MRCKTCGKTVGVSNRNHNKDKQQCARCHYLGQISAYPGKRLGKSKPTLGKYISGKKWCRQCAEWKIWDGLFCPDCRKCLRTRPERKVFREQVKVVVRY